MIRALLALLLLTLPAKGEEIVAGLSQNIISITTNFDGSEITIFGAVKREAVIDETTDLGVIVTVAGPRQEVTVRRKDKWAVIWVNQAAVEVDEAPSFYAVATSGPLDDVLNDTDDLRHSITIPRAIRSVGAPADVANASTFTDALIRIRTASGLYQMKAGSVDLSEDTLFTTDVALPANLVEGDYNVRIFLTRDGRVVSLLEKAIDVRKVGLERFLYALAHERPLIYGLLSLTIAIVAGWSASAVFRYIRT